MAYLHNDREVFSNAVALASRRFSITPQIAEKDYYVTMVLRELSDRLSFLVFKGGTSLSKCYGAIRRFSEDIDLTTDRRISQGEMRKLKEVIRDAVAALGLSIPNLEDTRSRRSFNQYRIQYDSVLSTEDDAIFPAVILETSLAEVSYPTLTLLSWRHYAK